MARRGWFVLLGFAGLAGAGALSFEPLSDLQAERRAAQSFAAVSDCLVGELPTDVTPNEHLRAISIAASLKERHAGWPGRCEPHVDALRAHLGDVHARRKKACGGPCDDPAFAALTALRDEASRAAELVDRGHSETFDADQMMSFGRALGFHDASADVAPPPAPVAMLRPSAMDPLYSGDYLRLLTNPAGDETLDLLFYEHESRYRLCNMTVAGDAPANCRDLSDTIPVGLAGELLAAEPGAPPRMFAQGGDGQGQALFDVRSGRQITPVSQRPAGGFVWRDGTMARLELEPPMKDVSLYRTRDDVVEPPVTLGLADRELSFGPRMVWDEVLWSQPEGAGRHRVFSRQVLPDDESQALGSERDLGLTVGLGDKPSMDVCRSERSLVLIFVGKRKRNSALATVVFRTPRGWQEPIHLRLGAGRFGVTCRGEGATISWIRSIDEEPAPDKWTQAHMSERGENGGGDRAPVRGRYEVHRLRCSADGCDHGRAVLLLHRYSLSSRYVAGDLGDAMVVLWRSAMGDVRMRLAPLEQLAASDEIPLFDDVEHDGFGWDLERDPIFGRSGGVLVLLSRQIGTSEASATYGVRIDAQGGVSPVSVAGGALGQPSQAL